MIVAFVLFQCKGQQNPDACSKKTHRDKIWLLLSDMDGYEASKAIRALNRADAVHIPIIAMTADAFEEDIRSCQEAGMVAHVTKPVDPQKLLKTLRDFIAKR